MTKNIWRKNRFSFDSKMQLLDVGRWQGEGFSAVCSHCPAQFWATRIFFFTLIQVNFYQYFCPVFIQRQKPQNHNKHPGQADHFFLIFPNIPQCGRTAQLRNINNTLTSCIMVFSKKRKKEIVKKHWKWCFEWVSQSHQVWLRTTDYSISPINKNKLKA